MNPFAIFQAIMDFVRGKQNADSAKDLEDIKSLTSIAVAFQQATSPDYSKVAPWVNTLVALMRPGLTLLLVIAHFFRPDVITEGLVKLAVGSWFGSRGVEKVVAVAAPILAGRNGNGNGNGNGAGH